MNYYRVENDWSNFKLRSVSECHMWNLGWERKDIMIKLPDGSGSLVQKGKRSVYSTAVNLRHFCLIHIMCDHS